MFDHLYPAKPAITFELPVDIEAQATEKLGPAAVQVVKIVFQGLGLTPQAGQEILAALLQSWKQIAFRVVQNNGADAIAFLAKTIDGLQSVSPFVRSTAVSLLQQFGPFIIQAILAQLA